jgi:hypothetical protein
MRCRDYTYENNTLKALKQHFQKWYLFVVIVCESLPIDQPKLVSCMCWVFIKNLLTRAGNMAQVVEHQPNKNKTLCLNTGTIKKSKQNKFRHTHSPTQRDPFELN